jgi:hypothetical protein
MIRQGTEKLYCEGFGLKLLGLQISGIISGAKTRIVAIFRLFECSRDSIGVCHEDRIFARLVQLAQR